MLQIHRIIRTQAIIHSHRKWLSTFTIANRVWSAGLHEPFLQARNFATSARQAESQQTQFRSKRKSPAKSRVDLRRKQKPAYPNQLNLDVLSARADLVDAIAAYDIKATIAAYNDLGADKPLAPKEVRALAQCTHQCLRRQLYEPRATRKQEDIDATVSFANQLVKDIRRERLPPNPFAHVHLLAIYKEAGPKTHDVGLEFWRWLENQDDAYISLEVYAVAIDISAINGAPLEEMEDMYQNALSRFPGAFFAYHLSPDAMVPDRESQHYLKGLPLGLLRSITLARLLRGDSRMAYLALDTAFRLCPASVDQRFLTPFLDERPISEAYTVFAMACRAGIIIPERQFTGLLLRLRSCSGLQSAAAHIVSLRMMLAAVYLQLGSSGNVTAFSVSELVIVLTQIFRLPGATGMSQEDRKRISDAVLAAISQVMEIFARYGALPTLSAFNAIITNLGAYGRIESVLEVALVDLKYLGMMPDDVTRRSLLKAAGQLKNFALIERFWKDIKDVATERHTVPEESDINTFIRAARLSGNESAAKAVSKEHKGHYGTTHDLWLKKLLRQPLAEMVQQDEDSIGKVIDTNEMLKGIEAIQADLAYVEERTRNQPAVQNFGNQELPIALLPMHSSDMEITMQRVYDSLTMEQTSQITSLTIDWQAEDANSKQARETSKAAHRKNVPVSSKTPMQSPTNISFGKLRYKNWKTINYLLRLAEQNDQKYNQDVAEALAVGFEPPARNMGLTADEVEAINGFGLSECVQREQRSGEDLKHDEQSVAKAEILRLRSTKS